MPINTEIEDKKTKFNLNNKKYFVTFVHHLSILPRLRKKFGLRDKKCKFGFRGGGGGEGGYSATSDLDLGKKLEVWISGGVFCNFGFGLRDSATTVLDLGKKLEVWIRGGGVFCNFGFGLREKVGSLDFGGGGYSATSDLDLGKKLEVWISGGGILQLRIWT